MKPTERNTQLDEEIKMIKKNKETRTKEKLIKMTYHKGYQHSAYNDIYKNTRRVSCKEITTSFSEQTNKNTNTKKSTLSLISFITTFITIILILLLSIPIVLGLPQIRLISQNNPLEYGSIQQIRLNITSNLTIIQALIEFESQNHTLEKDQNSTYTYQWIPSQKGVNTFTIYATDTAPLSNDSVLNETSFSSYSFIVQDTTPPRIILAKPNGTLNYNLIELEAITDENSTCKYDFFDVSYDSMNYGLSGAGLVHTKLRSFGDGTITVYFRCKDIDGNTGESKSTTFTVDTTPPVITDLIPTGTVKQESIELQFSTNEPATCKWDVENKNYEQLANSFKVTGSYFHQQPLNLKEGINTYYIICKDLVGNTNPVLVLNLELNKPPSASISIEKDNVYEALSQGTYTIRLEASEPLRQAPDLSLKYANHLISIPLEGSSESWKGYLIIPQEAGEQIGEFQYSGIDLKGMSGTEITKGKLVRIDTLPPAKIQELRLANQDNKIRISWAYEGEEAHHFNIYRSTTGNTDKTHYYSTSSTTSYLDINVTNKIGYFYRVSSVDKAGNEGLLSEEYFLMTEFQNTTGFVQDPAILEIINQKIYSMEKKVQDIDIRIARLEATPDQDIAWLLNQEDLISGLKEVKNRIQLLIGELKTYKETKTSMQELEAKTSIIEAKLKEYEKSTLKEISVRNKLEKEQPYTESLVLQAINSYNAIKSLDEKKKQIYTELVKNLNQEARKSQQIIDYELTYESGEQKRIIFIKETIIYVKDTKGVLVQEAMPSQGVKLSELEFNNPPDDINQLGAVWSMKKLERPEIIYKTKAEKELNQLQEIKTILFYDLDAFLNILADESSGSGGLITGKTITPGDSQKEQDIKLSLDTNTLLLGLGLIIMLALLTYYFVFLKSETKAEQEAETSIEESLVLQEQEVLKGIKNLIRVDDKLFSHQSFSYEELENKKIEEQVFILVRKSYLALQNNELEEALNNYNLAVARYPLLNLSLKNRLKLNLYLNTLREAMLNKIKQQSK